MEANKKVAASPHAVSVLLIPSDPNTIFRGNSLASKCIDEFMRMDGLHYLYDTLRDLLENIYDEHKPCEIDPSKLREGESLETNLVSWSKAKGGYVSSCCANEHLYQTQGT